jgi:hypothetical protein
MGGFMKNVGRKDNLIVSILSYTPHVTCSKITAPDLDKGQCAHVMNEMYADPQTHVFGPRGEAGVEAGLPYTWAGSCAVIVNTRGPLDTASWYEVWEGARAVAGMCVRRRLGGVSTGQGVLGNIFVIVKATRLGIGTSVVSGIASA